MHLFFVIQSFIKNIYMYNTLKVDKSYIFYNKCIEKGPFIFQVF